MNRNTQGSQAGFTLIELMIVVAIIAVLGALALPVYADYTVKAKVTEAVLAAGGCRTKVTEQFQTGTGDLTNMMTKDAGGGCTVPATQYVNANAADTTVDASGAIKVTLDIAALPKLTAGTNTIVLKPYKDKAATTAMNAAGDAGTSPAVWKCNAAAGSTVPTLYLPSACTQ